MARPLTDSDVAFWEDNIARASAIGRKMAILSEVVDDPDVLELILDTKSAADLLRLDLIKKMRELRNGESE